MPRLLSRLLLLTSLPLLAGAAFPTLYLKPVCLQQLHAPTNLTHAGDGSGRLFVCDQPGRIWIFQSGMLRPVPFLDLTAVVLSSDPPTAYSERGLLGLAFHPGYADPESPGHRRFYVHYSTASGANANPSTPQNHVSVVAEYQAFADDPNRADPGSQRVLLSFGQPQSNHNGGQLEFGPDGFLYIGTGDGGGSNDNDAGHTGGSGSKPSGGLGNALDRRNLLGKILRIDPLGSDGAGGAYGIPAGNPFVGQSQDFADPGLDGPMRGEIYAYGLRNPWRFSFDWRPGGSQRLFCGDVGQGRVEEINLIVAGGNYGWRHREGGFVFDAAMTAAGTAPGSWIDPVAQYQHPGISPSLGLPALGLSVTGGFVYRGSAIPALQGKYVFGDYGATAGSASGRLMGLEETAPGSGSFTLTSAIPLVGGNPFPLRVLTLGEDEAGELYVGGKTTAGVQALDQGFPAGGLFRIVAAPALVTQSNMAPVRDTSIFSEKEDYSNATGNLFAGRIANGSGAVRRALLAFALEGVPPGARFTSASLQLNVNLVPSGQVTNSMSLYRVTEAWGEGTSNGLGTGAPATPNDATWTHRLWDGTVWATPGGSIAVTASASQSVGAAGSYTWQSPALVADLQAWLAAPAGNHGWLLRGDESTDATAKRFDSRESDSLVRPRLNFSYVPPAPYEAWLVRHFPELPLGGYLDPEGDADGDRIANQLEYAFGFAPDIPDADSQFATSAAPGGGGTQFTTSFRRDSAATDLVCELQASTDLAGWVTLARSTAGAAPVGLNGGVILADSVVAGSVRLVSVRETRPAGATPRRFVRLRVQRSL